MGIDILTLAAARAGKGSGGSASKYKQPDWGAETAIVDILPEAEYTATAETEGAAPVMQLVPLVAEQVYTVTYNGVEYNCTAMPIEEDGVVTSFALGNMAIEGGEDTGEPFLCVFAARDEAASEMGLYGIILPLDGSTTFTLSIKGAGEIIHPIPAEYTENESVLRVNLGYNYSSADKTYDEIMAAINAGKFVYARMQGAADENSPLTFFLILTSIDLQSRICFVLLGMGETICCNPDNTWGKYNV